MIPPWRQFVEPNPAGITPLARQLAARIEANGPLSIHDYMEACLYDPRHGYYAAGTPIGRGGDFITAPEISQIFGELIGLWAGEVWRQMGSPSSIRLVELGPGKGTLSADALRALRVVPGFLEAASIDLVETSQTLREMQRNLLTPAQARISWHDRLEQIPPGPAIVIANEFLDCLPVQHFIFEERTQAWRERLVDFADGSFVAVTGSRIALPKQPRAEPFDGAIFEYRPAVARIIEALAARARNSPIAALFIDYGYERPSLGETLQAVRGHRFVPVFDSPGKSDLTAHVDFVQLGREGKSSGLDVHGPMPMGEWLLRLGLETRTRQLLQSAPEGGASRSNREFDALPAQHRWAFFLKFL